MNYADIKKLLNRNSLLEKEMVINFSAEKAFICKMKSKTYFYTPLKMGAYCFATVGRSVCRPSVVRTISFDPFTWSIPNLVQGLPSMSRWSLFIFRSNVQRSRSNHSSQPTVLSAQYLLTPSLDQYQTWCRACPQWVNGPFWFSGQMFKGQGQTTLLSPLCCPLYIF